MSKSSDTPELIARRKALQLLVAGAAAVPLAGFGSQAQTTSRPGRLTTDPDLVNPVVPWDNILTDTEMKTVKALCDMILPQDEASPSASAVGVPAFINEWISAPYPDQISDREAVRGGLVWLDSESGKRFDSVFHALDHGQQTTICDDIHHLPDATSEFRQAAAFFDRFRWLTLCGFYTTDAGRRDVGFIGNVPLDEFPGATPEQLKQLGLETG